MWVSAFLVMEKVYAEILSAKYSDDDLKDPIAYISKGLGSRKLAAVFLKNDFISGRFRIGIHLGNMENEQKIKVT